MKIYCSGIGGIGLSAYAALQKAAGHEVRGSDQKESALLEDLIGQGITVSLRQDGSQIPKDTDFFVYSEAVPPSAPERLRAKEFGIPQQSYFQALGEFSKSFFTIAVCGTHGKSSVTAMLARVLIEGGKDPTVVLGTKSPDLFGRNWRRGGSSLFLVEACEYRRSFHFLSPHIVLMTTVDGDHFDVFSSLKEYQEAFVDFLRFLPPEGIVVTHSTDPDCHRVAMASQRRIVDAEAFPLPSLTVAGMHMRQNARLAGAAASLLEVSVPVALQALKGFKGTWRRMEIKGTSGDGITVVDDYAHHPREVRATIAAMREQFPTNRIVCVFQPHTHDRTLKLYEDFLSAFSGVDIVIVPNVYEARRERDTAMVDVDTFVWDLERRGGVKARNGFSLKKTEEILLREVLVPGDVLLCMGAGDVTELAETMVHSHCACMSRG